MRETHFTIEFCSRYFERELSSQETLALFRHIEVCNRCAKTYDIVLAQYRNPSSLRFNFSIPEFDSEGHLDGEELIAYSQGVIEKEELVLLEHHAMNCIRCKNALENIVAQKQELKSHVKEIKEGRRLKVWLNDLWQTTLLSFFPYHRKNFVYAMSLISLLIIGGLVIASFWKSYTPRTITGLTPDNRRNIQEVTNNNSQANINSKTETSTNDSVINVSGVNRKQDKAAVKDEKPLISRGNSKPNKQLVIKDRDDEEILILSGKIVGAKDVSPELSEDIIAALNGKDITPTPFYSSDDSAVIKTRGIKPYGESEQEMRLLSPVNKTIRTLSPTLEWESHTLLPDIKYQVSVVDEDFNLVAQSPVLTATQWKLEIPLVRGKTYRWQVKLFVSGEVLSSTTPDKGASFRVISDADNLEVTESEKTIKSHLALGVLYLKLNLLDEAEREICALQRLNPKSKMIKRLLQKICKKRSPEDGKLRCTLSQSN